MKKLLINFAESVLSKQQMLAVKGGQGYCSICWCGTSAGNPDYGLGFAPYQHSRRNAVMSEQCNGGSFYCDTRVSACDNTCC